MMVRCAPGNDGCLMMSVLSCSPSCSFGTLAAEAEEIMSTLLVVENEQELGDEITAKCERYVPTGRCPSMRDGTGSGCAPAVH